ncbi:MAG: cache domain-containing protein [Betaproteobacteria bacterium]|nr:cache domain-containing protein [Betaproteobacteria bacterium]
MKNGVAMVAMAAAALAGGAVWAAENVTAKEAEAMVKKGVAYVKANGKEKAYAEITNTKGQFVDRDLFLSVVQFDGKVLAHGANEKLVGKMLIDIKDIDGKEFLRERIELAKSKPVLWQDYKFSNPLTKKIEPKTAYCERVDDTILCGGVFKK